MFNNKIYIPEYKNENSIFYFVREPGLNPVKYPEYVQYLNFMEGVAKTINLSNYNYDGVLILDGSFPIHLNYNEQIKICVGDSKINTINMNKMI